MDFIGWWPTNVLILMFFAVPVMAVLATVRRVLFRGREGAAAWHFR